MFENNPSLEKMAKKLALTYPRYNSWPSQLPLKKARRAIKEKLWNQLNISELLENILAQKIFLLNQYPLLGTKIEDNEYGCELYQCLYRTLAQHLPLEDLKRKMSSAHIDFTTAKKIDLETTYKAQAQQNLELLSQHKKEAYEKTAHLFDQGIKVALKGNFEFLTELNSQLFFENNKSPYLLIALNEKNWETLLNGENFFWMDREVFKKGKEELMALVEKEGDRQKLISKTLKLISWGLMGAGGLAWLTGWGGVATMIIGRSVAHKLLLLSGVSYGLKAVWDHINHDRFAQLAQSLYVANIERSYYRIQKDYRLIAERDYKEVAYVIGNFILLGRGQIFKPLQFLFRSVKTLSHKTLNLTNKKLEFFRKKVTAMKYSVLTKFSYYRRLIFRSEQILNEKHLHQRLSHLMGQNAAKLAMTAKSIRNLVTNNFLFKKALGKLNFIRESEFIQRELIVEFIAVLASEILLRKDRFLKEFPHVIFNMLFATGITFTIASQTYKNAILSHVPQSRPPIWPHKGERFALKTMGKNWATNSLQLAPPIAWVSGLLSGGLLLHRALIEGKEIGEEDVMRTLETFFWMITLVSITSPPRSQWVGRRINPAIDELYLRYPRRSSNAGIEKAILNSVKWAEDIKVPASIGNNMIGSFSITYILQRRGIQSSEISYTSPFASKKDLTYIYHESNEENANYLFPVILES